MTHGFRRDAGGGVVIDLSHDEATLLRSMASLVLELVEPPEPTDDLAAIVGIGARSELPDDPVLARLFPDAYNRAEDPDAASDFRRYTEDTLRASKRANAETVVTAIPADGGQVRLDAGQAMTWLKSLNDVRLALGIRLGVDEDTLSDDTVDHEKDEPTVAALVIYDWLTGLQESLVRAVG